MLCQLMSEEKNQKLSVHIQLFLENFEKLRFKLVPTYGRDHLESKMNDILGKT